MQQQPLHVWIWTGVLVFCQIYSILSSIFENYGFFYNSLVCLELSFTEEAQANAFVLVKNVCDIPGSTSSAVAEV